MKYFPPPTDRASLRLFCLRLNSCMTESEFEARCYLAPQLIPMTLLNDYHSQGPEVSHCPYIDSASPG